jgi:ABC-type phosphate/phosphonate transport system substrate-binding protein
MRLLLPPSVGVPRAIARGELLERSLTSEMGEPVIVEVAADYAVIEQRIRAREVDLAWAPAAICARVAADVHAIYKAVRAGRSTYRSALVARTDARLSLTRLAGKRAAWVDPLSLGGYVLAVDHLAQLGIVPSRTFASEAFIGDHPAALAAILEGEADVGAVSVSGPEPEDVMHALGLHAGRAGAEQMSALAITDPAPSDALLVTKALDQERATALTNRLFHERGGRSSQLRLAMEADGFERAGTEEYVRLREVLDRVQAMRRVSRISTP